jgi:peptidoglycan hydrolase-like protein with peptidoglycan-binding domain
MMVAMVRRRLRWMVVPFALLCAATISGCGDARGTTPAAPGPTSAAAATSTTVVPTAPTPSTTTTTTIVKYETGSSGAEVTALQYRLTVLGYRPGDADGSYRAQTASAVLAFQKREGLGLDGIAGPETLTRLAAPTGAGPRDTSGTHVEIDLDRQILFAVEGGGAVHTINISSGNGKNYSVPGGGSGVAITPTGDYTVLRRIDGFHEAPLGVLYRPLFFYGGYAIHGSSSVPAYPASHGCVRTSNFDQDYLWPTFSNGTAVAVYSGAPDAPTMANVDPNVQPGA